MAEYYMRADGTAANKAAAIGPASDAAACMNITVHDGETFSAGDLIYISSQGGNYDTSGGSMAPPSSGSSGNPITYQAVSGETPIFDSGGASTMCFTMPDKSYITVDGLKFQNATARMLFIRANTTSISNIIVQNCTFTGNSAGYGIQLYCQDTYNISDVTISDCTFDTIDDDAIRFYWATVDGTGNIYNVTIENCTFDTITNAGAACSGINMAFSNVANALIADRLPYGITIQNNTFYQINNRAITMYCKDTSANLIAGNTVSYCGYGEGYQTNTFQINYCKNLTIEDNDISYTQASAEAGDGNAVILDWANTDIDYISDGVVVRYNNVHHNTDASSSAAGISVYRAKNCEIYYNISHNNRIGIVMSSDAGGACTGNVFYNNTIVNNTDDGVVLNSDSPTTTWTNNIIANNGAEGVDDNSANDPTFTYNCLYNNTGGNYSGFTLGTGCIELDPKFSNASGNDYLLQSNSPCKDKGDKSVWTGTASITDYAGNRITNAAGQIVTPGFKVSMGAHQHQYNKSVRKPILSAIMKKLKFVR